jgi:hypothetical protein
LAIPLVIGTLDATLPDNRDLRAHLTALHVAHEYLELPRVGQAPTALIEGVPPKHLRRDITCVGG